MCQIIVCSLLACFLTACGDSNEAVAKPASVPVLKKVSVADKEALLAYEQALQGLEGRVARLETRCGADNKVHDELSREDQAFREKLAELAERISWIREALINGYIVSPDGKTIVIEKNR